MEQQRNESKEFLDDLTLRDQRMFLAVLTIVITADSRTMSAWYIKIPTIRRIKLSLTNCK